MKSIKFVLINSIILLSISTYGQIKVNSAGHIGIGTDGNSNYKAYIYNPSLANYARGLYVKLEQPALNSYKQYSIQSKITSGKGVTYGIYSSAYNSSPSNQGQAVGIYSRAGNATNGWNYAIFGHLLGSNDGASIFGAVTDKGGVVLNGQWAGYFRGDVYVEDELWASEVTESDIKLKKDIIDIDSSLCKILKIKGQKYNLKLPNEIEQEKIESDTLVSDTFDYSKLQKYKKKHYGIVAQELQKVFPDLVYERSNGFLGIKYDGLIPVIIEAIKEQQTQIKNLQAEIEKLKITDPKTKSTADNNLTNSSQLFQNQPNPFSVNTYITYYLPDVINKATIYIYDLQGRQVKAIDLNDRGQGSAMIHGSELNAGTYHYTLIADGQIVGTHTMILTN